jgi:hypothetical protein
MFRPILLAGALIASAAQAAHAAPPQTPDASTLTRCATPSPTREEALSVQARIRSLNGFRPTPDFRLTIPIAFHVITCDGGGNVPQSQLDAQVAELNQAYRGTGFSFVLSSVDRTEDCHWFNRAFSPGTEKNMKKQLATDVTHTLNVYTVVPAKGIIGWSYLPQTLPEDSYLQGVVIHYATLPGGTLAPFNEGGTLDHEVGHYLGLLHTFENGCVAPGDFVDDTPFEATPAFGCPIGRNTCPQPGDDPIHNYMDYTDDACYTEFTPDQIARMQSVVAVYRPILVGSALALSLVTSSEASGAPPTRASGTPTALAFRGAWPNPFSKQTTLRFALPESGPVSLALFNVAGERVATLIDGTLPAGEQSMALRSGSLAPGMYFVSLRFAGQTVSRSVVLLP